MNFEISTVNIEARNFLLMFEIEFCKYQLNTLTCDIIERRTLISGTSVPVRGPGAPLTPGCAPERNAVSAPFHVKYGALIPVPPHPYIVHLILVRP